MYVCGTESVHTFSPPCHVDGLIISQDHLCSKVKSNFTLLQESGRTQRDIQTQAATGGSKVPYIYYKAYNGYHSPVQMYLVQHARPSKQAL